MEFREHYQGPGASPADDTWAWPINEAELRHALLVRGLRVALVRLFPGTRRWWDGGPSVPLALIDGLTPDLEDRLSDLPGYADCLPAELRVWGVPVVALDRVSNVFEREGLPRLLDWLQERLPDEPPGALRSHVTLRLDGDVVRLAEG